MNKEELQDLLSVLLDASETLKAKTVKEFLEKFNAGSIRKIERI